MQATRRCNSKARGRCFGQQGTGFNQYPFIIVQAAQQGISPAALTQHVCMCERPAVLRHLLDAEKLCSQRRGIDIPSTTAH